MPLIRGHGQYSQQRGMLSLERLRVELLGKKGAVTAALRGLGALPPQERAPMGARANALKVQIESLLTERLTTVQEQRLESLAADEWADITFVPSLERRGHLHPLTLILREVKAIFSRLGYEVAVGPQVEDEFHNFEALNITAGHPARENWDSFYFSPELLLRAHTSPVQIRAMQRIKEPPIYIITPGRCYRRDAPEATRLPYFSQVEGLAVDVGLTVGDMKGTLLYMIQSLYGRERKVRVRPSYFPFTEPSFEFDVTCGICGGMGCKSCRHKGWLEVGGCGMVHPQVLRNGGIDPTKWNGYAWGFGIERMTMLKHDVDDIRLFYDSDLRFLEQF